MDPVFVHDWLTPASVIRVNTICTINYLAIDLPDAGSDSANLGA